LTAWEASVRIRRRFENFDLGGLMMRTWSVLLGILVAAMLVGTGCGGGESKSGGDAAKPTPPAPAPQAATTPTTAPPAAAAPAEGEDDEPAPLLAWADSDTDEGKAPLAIAFTADVEGGKAPLTYVWKFGDGTPDSNEANPKHTYSKPGTYRADLEVKDSSGDSDSDYLEITVE
jgi:PKD domain-containing protein